MRRAERVVHVDVRVGRERLRELRVVLLLLGVEAQVLEEQQLAGSEPPHGVLGSRAERVAGHRDRASEQLGQPLRDRPEPERVLDLAVGAAQVTGEDEARALREQVLDRRQRGADALVVGDLAVLEGDVEIDADEDAFARRVGVADGELVHGGVLRGADRRGPADEAYAAPATGRRAPTKLMRSATRQL